MSKIKKLLSTLEDFELLALHKYRFSTFMKSSQNKIMDEIQRRNLHIEDTDELIQKAKGSTDEIQNSDCCPRCYSRKFYVANEKDWIHYQHYSHEINNRFKTCVVCLYSQDKNVYEKKKNRGRIVRVIKRLFDV